MLYDVDDVVRSDWPDAVALEPAVELPVGSCLFREGDSIRTVLLITRGVVKLTVHSGDRDILVAVKTSGWMLGAAPAILGLRHLATAVALTPCELRSLSVTRFRTECQGDARVSEWVMRMLACEDWERHRRTATLGLGRADILLEWLLVHLFRAAGVEYSDGALRLAFHLSVVDIAGLVGVSRQWTSRLLRDMARVGSIERRRDWLALPRGSRLWSQARGAKATADRRG